MSTIITSIICGIVVNYSLFYILKKLVNSSENINSFKNMLLIIALAIIQTILYNKNYSIMYIITNFISMMIFNKLILKEEMLKTIVSTSIVFLILMMADLIDSLIMVNLLSFETIRSIWYIRILNNIIVSIFSLLIFSIPKLREKFQYFINRIEERYIQIIVLFFILMFVIIIVTYCISNNFKFDVNYISNVFIMVALVIFCYIFINENNQYNKLNDQYDSLFKCIQTFEEWIENEQLNRHEYKNQLAVLRCMTKEKRVKEKIDSIIADNINIDDDTVNQLRAIPNGGLKGLLYYKVVIAEKDNINVEIDVSLKNAKLIKKIDENKMKIICRLVGIYLDNAIEATRETEERILSIEIYEIDKIFNIVISNTFIGNTKDLEKINEKGYSTKGRGRGNGLYFARKMIEKNKWLEQKQSIKNDFYTQFLKISLN